MNLCCWIEIEYNLCNNQSSHRVPKPKPVINNPVVLQSETFFSFNSFLMTFYIKSSQFAIVSRIQLNFKSKYTTNEIGSTA